MRCSVCVCVCVCVCGKCTSIKPSHITALIPPSSSTSVCSNLHFVHAHYLPVSRLYNAQAHTRKHAHTLCIVFCVRAKQDDVSVYFQSFLCTHHWIICKLADLYLSSSFPIRTSTIKTTACEWVKHIGSCASDEVMSYTYQIFYSKLCIKILSCLCIK